MRRLLSTITMFGFLIATAIMGLSGRALADSYTCTVSHVVMSPSSDNAKTYTNRYLSIQCADPVATKFFIVYTQPSGQAAGPNSCYIDLDTMKMWQSMATSAKLSGAQLFIIFNSQSNCPGGSASSPANILQTLDF